jgi:hypothetical protein
MTFTKDPDAVLDYSVDWSLWLGEDQITGSQWILPPGALLEQVTDTHTATRATIWLRGGEAGKSYVVTNRIVTSGGRTDDRSITVRVEDR